MTEQIVKRKKSRSEIVVFVFVNFPPKIETAGEIMGQAESNLSRRIVRALNSRGCNVFKVWGNAFQRRGVSDIQGSARGGFALSIETKIAGKENTLTEQQRRWLIATARTGSNARVGVATSVEQAIAIAEGRERQSEFWD